MKETKWHERNCKELDKNIWEISGWKEKREKTEVWRLNKEILKELEWEKKNEREKKKKKNVRERKKEKEWHGKNER